MSIIDKKGKLFGKLNIIDLIVIVLIVAVVALLGLKLKGGQEGGLAGEGQPVVFTVQVDGVEEGVYTFIRNELEKGPSQLIASGEMLEGYVTAVEGTLIENDDAALRENSYGGLSSVKYDRAGTYDLVFTIEATVTDNLTSKLGTQEIRVGKSHIVKTTTFELENGTILSCERLGTQ
ncbi:MAG: DUF4330 family protein [Bacillota bacterium]|nr:DUF4330 family protein [Bacillota bacterium]